MQSDGQQAQLLSMATPFVVNQIRLVEASSGRRRAPFFLYAGVGARLSFGATHSHLPDDRQTPQR